MSHKTASEIVMLANSITILEAARREAERLEMDRLAKLIKQYLDEYRLSYNPYNEKESGGVMNYLLYRIEESNGFLADRVITKAACLCPWGYSHSILWQTYSINLKRIQRIITPPMFRKGELSYTEGVELKLYL